MKQKEKVERDRNQRQNQLDGVTSEPLPVPRRPAVPDELEEGERPAGEIEENVPDVPPGRRPPMVVAGGLGNVLYERYEHLYAAQRVQPAAGSQQRASQQRAARRRVRGTTGREKEDEASVEEGGYGEARGEGTAGWGDRLPSRRRYSVVQNDLEKPGCGEG